MSMGATASVRRALSPARVAGVAVLLGVAAKGLAGRLADPDLWWHLKTGQLIVARHGIPAGDPYSFTRPGARWIVQEWGSEVILRGINAAFGLRGIVVWRALMLVLIYALVAKLILREAGSGLGGWAIVALAAFAGATSWTERPNLHSFLLFVVTLHLVHAKRMWWFVPIAGLWANLHGMVLLGLGLVALVAVVEWLKVALRWEGADRTWATQLSAVFGASVVASFANPYGPRLLAHGFGLVRDVSPVVTEWASPSFHEAGNILFLALIVVTVAGMALAPRRPDPTDVALAAAFVVLGLVAVRNLPVAGIVLGWVASRSLPDTVHAAIARRTSNRPRGRPVPALDALALIAVLAVFGMLIARNWPDPDPISRTLPVATIRSIPDGARVFAYDAWAGLVLYERWPDARVFADTRVDFYGRSIVQSYRRTIAGLDALAALDDACATHALIRMSDPLEAILARTSGWRLMRSEQLDDATATLYERTGLCPTSG